MWPCINVMQVVPGLQTPTTTINGNSLKTVTVNVPWPSRIKYYANLYPNMEISVFEIVYNVTGSGWVIVQQFTYNQDRSTQTTTLTFALMNTASATVSTYHHNFALMYWGHFTEIPT